MKDARPGQVLPVEDDYDYPPGFDVVAFDHGYWTVEKDRKHFRVFMCCVQSGFEYEIGGRWVPADDWRVEALRPCAPGTPVLDGLKESSNAHEFC